ncbi:MAG: nucleotidyltransferase domain-containing protein [Candidatus Omnitrophica bacterium]|nr:nucleotidyltransferase domain-containing protein [Candidatus Omnitrophota bacterium]
MTQPTINSLTSKLLKDIKDTFSAFPNVKTVILYGSRATDDYEETSDIDLAVSGPHITDLEMTQIKNALEKIHTILKFDVTHFENITKQSLKEDITNEGICLYES